MTGKQRLVDTAGRVEKFKKKYEPKAEKPQVKKKQPTVIVKKAKTE
jgi:hypothetical protein